MGILGRDDALILSLEALYDSLEVLHTEVERAAERLLFFGDDAHYKVFL